MTRGEIKGEERGLADRVLDDYGFFVLSEYFAQGV
jgi:hypothetical protein